MSGYLAKQTAEATLDLKTQIDDVQGTSKTTREEMSQISSVIGGMNEIVATIAAAVEEQTAAMKSKTVQGTFRPDLRN